ncbi:hypothetical protein M1512_04640, partial [Patescibacteria group bacterium]|nr:hypothetical protein [Patescibacteria group bacterium]
SHEYDLITKEHVDRERTNEELFYAYSDYLMRLGDNKEKAEFLISLNLPLVLHERRIHYSPEEYKQAEPIVIE